MIMSLYVRALLCFMICALIWDNKLQSVIFNLCFISFIPWYQLRSVWSATFYRFIRKIVRCPSGGSAVWSDEAGIDGPYQYVCENLGRRCCLSLLTRPPLTLPTFESLWRIGSGCEHITPLERVLPALQRKSKLMQIVSTGLNSWWGDIR